MREIRTHQWCDGCYDIDERYVEATDSPSLAVCRAGSPQSRTLDLCAEHGRGLLGPLRELLAEHGRRPDGPLPGATAVPPGRTVTARTATPTKPAIRVDLPEPVPTLFDPVPPREAVGPRSWACPICGIVMRRRGAIPHVYAWHRPGEKQPVSGAVCPDCGARFTSGKSTGSHRAQAHGWNPLAEALDGAQR